jgi:hypothetical protein
MAGYRLPYIFYWLQVLQALNLLSHSPLMYRQYLFLLSLDAPHLDLGDTSSVTISSRVSSLEQLKNVRLESLMALVFP